MVKPLLGIDVTCPDTFAPSHVMLATSEAGAVADQAGDRKRVKYADLQSSHLFIPVAIETAGVFGQEALTFFQELGHRLWVKTGEPLSHHHLSTVIPYVLSHALLHPPRSDSVGDSHFWCKALSGKKVT